MIHRHILRHGKYERRLTHRRTGSDNDQVRILPPRSDLIQRIETGTRTAQTLLLVRRFLQQIHRILDNGIDLGYVLLYIPLGYLKQFTFRFLHQVFHVDRFVKSLSLDHRSERDQLPCQIFLGDNTGMIFDMRTTGNFTGELRNIKRSTHLIQFAAFPQLLRHRQHVDRPLAGCQIHNSCIDHLVRLFVKAFRLQDLTDDRISIFFKHQGT